jgi:hypothetical protein
MTVTDHAKTYIKKNCPFDPLSIDENPTSLSQTVSEIVNILFFKVTKKNDYVRSIYDVLWYRTVKTRPSYDLPFRRYEWSRDCHGRLGGHYNLCVF